MIRCVLGNYRFPSCTRHQNLQQGDTISPIAPIFASLPTQQLSRSRPSNGHGRSRWVGKRPAMGVAAAGGPGSAQQWASSLQVAGKSPAKVTRRAGRSISARISSSDQMGFRFRLMDLVPRKVVVLLRPSWLVGVTRVADERMAPIAALENELRVRPRTGCLNS